MKNMSPEECEAFVNKKAKERERIQSEINNLDEQRRDYIANQSENNKQTNTLDAAMLKVIKEQASNKNYKFE